MAEKYGKKDVTAYSVCRDEGTKKLDVNKKILTFVTCNSMIRVYI